MQIQGNLVYNGDVMDLHVLLISLIFSSYPFFSIMDQLNAYCLLGWRKQRLLLLVHCNYLEMPSHLALYRLNNHCFIFFLLIDIFISFRHNDDNWIRPFFKIYIYVYMRMFKAILLYFCMFSFFPVSLYYTLLDISNVCINNTIDIFITTY